MDMHEVVRRVTETLAAAPAHPVDDAAVALLTERHWSESPLAATPVEAGYRQAADAMIGYFVQSRQGRAPRRRGAAALRRCRRDDHC